MVSGHDVATLERSQDIRMNKQDIYTPDRAVMNHGRQHIVDAELPIVRAIRMSGTPVDAFRVLLTPALAERLLATWDKNRPITRSTVDKYAALQSDGKWDYTGQGLVISSTGKMLNGQHTCLGVRKSGRTIEVLVVCGVDDAAYRSMDAGRKRGASDYLHGLARRNTVAAVLAILYVEERAKPGDNLISRHEMPPGDAAEMLVKHPDLGTLPVNRPLAASLRVSPSIVLYSMYKTRLYSPPKSDEFWDGVENGVGLEAGDARLALRNTLLSQPRRAPVGKAHSLAFIMKAWSAFLTRKKMKLVRWGGGESFPVWP